MTTRRRLRKCYVLHDSARSCRSCSPTCVPSRPPLPAPPPLPRLTVASASVRVVHAATPCTSVATHPARFVVSSLTLLPGRRVRAGGADATHLQSCRHVLLVTGALKAGRGLYLLHCTVHKSAHRVTLTPSCGMWSRVLAGSPWRLSLSLQRHKHARAQRPAAQPSPRCPFSRTHHGDVSVCTLPFTSCIHGYAHAFCPTRSA